jgi:hypothetical protein
LNGVTVGEVAPGSQPRLNGVLGLLNQSPRWYWCVGENVVVPPGDTEKVSTSNTPWTVALPLPNWPASTSVWYQDTPNGASGCWITNRSKSALAGMPWIETFMMSLSFPGVMVTRPPALGRQAAMLGDGTRLNENEAAGRAPGLAADADAVVRPTDTAAAATTAVTPSPAVVRARARWWRCLILRMESLLVLMVASWRLRVRCVRAPAMPAKR